MINFENENYSIVVDEKKGCVKSLVQGDKDYIFKENPLFVLRFRNKDGSFYDVDTYSMNLVSSLEKKDEAKILYEAKDNSFSAELCITFRENMEWKINVKNNTDLVLENVDFALIVPKDLVADGGKSKVLWGFNEGVLVDNIDNRKDVFGFLEFGYPGVGLMPVFPAIVETQFMAYFDGIHGLYLATHDTEGNIKAIDFYPEDGGIKLYFRLLTNSDFGCDFSMEYLFVMQMFSGEWQVAADIYSCLLYTSFLHIDLLLEDVKL